MEAQQAVARFWQLPAEAQRVVVDLIAYLDRTAEADAPTEAILLPPVEAYDVPTTWPENEWANPEFFGAWADRADITDSTEYVRQMRREQRGNQG